MKNYIFNILETIKDGGNPETYNLELKKKLWDIKNSNPEIANKQENEFIKDLTAMANTILEDGYIIVGIDEKNGELENTEPEEEIIKEFKKIIAKKIQNPIFVIETFVFTYKEKKLFIIKIPKTFDKPYVIKQYIKNNTNYQNYMPIRNLDKSGTNVVINSVNKRDLDMFYSEKQGKKPNNYLEIRVKKLVKITESSNDKVKQLVVVTLPVYVRNIGNNVNCITSASLYSSNGDISVEIDDLKRMNIKEEINLKNDIQKIKPNDIFRLGMKIRIKTFSDLKEKKWIISIADFEENVFTSNEFEIV